MPARACGPPRPCARRWWGGPHRPRTRRRGRQRPAASRSAAGRSHSQVVAHIRARLHTTTSMTCQTRSRFGVPVHSTRGCRRVSRQRLGCSPFFGSSCSFGAAALPLASRPGRARTNCPRSARVRAPSTKANSSHTACGTASPRRRRTRSGSEGSPPARTVELRSGLRHGAGGMPFGSTLGTQGKGLATATRVGGVGYSPFGVE